MYKLISFINKVPRLQIGYNNPQSLIYLVERRLEKSYSNKYIITTTSLSLPMSPDLSSNKSLLFINVQRNLGNYHI